LYDYDIGRVANDDSARARWWGLEAGASRMLWNRLRLSLGADFRQGTQLTQANYDVDPFASYLDVQADQTVIGTYADSRLEITKSLSLTAGVRLDHYNSFGQAINPRGALIWKPRQGTTLKLLYGQAFRAPNIYQLEYVGPGQRANPDLDAETISTYEIEAEQYFGRHWRGRLSLFRNDVSGLIDTATDADGLRFFDNVGDARINGVEAEIEGKWDNGLLVRASYTRQDATNTKSGERLINSPVNVAKAQVSIPVYRDKVFGSVELLYASDRLTQLRQKTGEAWLLNATLYSRELLPGLECSASVYNLLNQKYRTPGGGEHTQDTIAQDGTTFWLKALYRF
jgi:iron complex outermembrane receptor protein